MFGAGPALWLHLCFNTTGSQIDGSTNFVGHHISATFISSRI
jgi:hypothetical protein